MNLTGIFAKHDEYRKLVREAEQARPEKVSIPVRNDSGMEIASIEINPEESFARLKKGGSEMGFTTDEFRALYNTLKDLLT